MPRRKNAISLNLVHGSSRQAGIRINGRDNLLGSYGYEESRLKYGKVICDAAAGLSVNSLGASANQVGSRLVVAELLLVFKRHADAD